jgi:hypothetical protein
MSQKHFGLPHQIVVMVWDRAQDILPLGAKPKHKLWTLYLLKILSIHYRHGVDKHEISFVAIAPVVQVSLEDNPNVNRTDLARQFNL